jgi:hypothetical protein
VWDDDARFATVLEINPRPTTSYVGLSRWLSPGTLAGAWLRVVSSPGDPGRLGPQGTFPGRDHADLVTFAADGGMMEPDGGVAHERRV